VNFDSIKTSQPIEIGILHAQDGDLTPAGAKLIQILRKVAKK
jgi:hypothetical protein